MPISAWRRFTVVGIVLALELTAGAASAAWAPSGPMGTPRQRHTATRLDDGRVLVTGGYTAGDWFYPIESAEIYDPASGTFADANAMKLARVEHTATLLADGRVLVTGGSVDGEQHSLSSVEIYDPATGAWNDAAPLLEARSGHAAVRLADGRVLVVGGDAGFEGGYQISATSEVYDPLLDAWALVSPMSEAREHHTATLLDDGRVLVAGGDQENYTAVGLAEIFDPATAGFEPAGALEMPRTFHAAAPLADGRVLVVGGVGKVGDAITGLASVEIFEANSGAFQSGADMLLTQGAPAATALPDGRVLVSSAGTSQAYDPLRGSWSFTGTMSETRYDHTVTLLGNGLVLAVGGKTDSVDVVADVLRESELWDPAVPVSEVNGTPCTGAEQCTSGFCVDGVCCDSACSAGACDACSFEAGAPWPGECTLLPTPECSVSECQSTLECPPGFVCSASQCVDDGLGPPSPSPRPDGNDDDDLGADSNRCVCGVAIGAEDAPDRARFALVALLLALAGLRTRRHARRPQVEPDRRATPP
jgi:hypothetical protein